MGCPETHKAVIAQLCETHYYPGITRPCAYEATCNHHFARWLETEPEVQRLHHEYLKEKEEESMMNRKTGLKPREAGTAPPEKLLKVLQTIYPEQVAKELFKKLQGEDGDDHG